MAAVATGDLLMCCNDDVVFQTRGWPGLLLAEARKYPDGIFNFGVNVGLNDDFFPFSIVSRQLVRTLGFINDERLLFSDVFLLDVAKHFNRAIRVKSVTIFHDWAGHGADETRRDANRHEFEVVFKDASGDWTDEYRRKHDQVVAEAVAKIERAGVLALAQAAIQRFEAYVPPEERHNTLWPPTGSHLGARPFLSAATNRGEWPLHPVRRSRRYSLSVFDRRSVSAVAGRNHRRPALRVRDGVLLPSRSTPATTRDRGVHANEPLVGRPEWRTTVRGRPPQRRSR